MHATKSPRERAFLVGAELTGDRSPWSAEDSLRELELLADTAGLEVVGSLYQRLKQPYPKHFIGPGKVEEIAALREELGYDLVVFDDELSPSQTRNVEEILKVRVLDRAGLILDIFATHARTHEGRIQVELAQYKYLLPRLRRQWTHLERQAGGGGGSAGGVVGLRGPGETQLETDRRIISRRIALLEDQIDDVHRQRELYRSRRRRSGIPVVALVGYTNAGKSTLLNALSGADVRAEDRLFATLDPTTRQVAHAGRPGDPADRHGRLYPEAAARAGGGVPRHAGGDQRGRPAAARPRYHPRQRLAADRHRDRDPRGAEGRHAPDADRAQQGRPAGWCGRRPILGGWPASLACPTTISLCRRSRAGAWTRCSSASTRRSGERMAAITAFIPYKRNDLVALWRQRGVVDEERFEAEGTYLVGRLPAAIVGQIAPFQVEAKQLNVR